MIRYNTKRYWGYSTDIKPINAQIGDRFLDMDTQFEYVFSDFNQWKPILKEPSYRVFTALLTQNGGSDNQILSSSAVTQGITYFIDGAGSNSDFSNVGGPVIGTNSYYFIATNSDIPNDYDGANLLYNTGAPVATVLENTIGNVWFSYNDVGNYVVSSNGLFIGNKTYLTIELYFGSLDGQGTFRNSFYYDGDSSLRINTQSTGDGYTWTFSNDILLNTPIEIRVYN